MNDVSFILSAMFCKTLIQFRQVFLSKLNDSILSFEWKPKIMAFCRVLDKKWWKYGNFFILTANFCHSISSWKQKMHLPCYDFIPHFKPC